MVTVVDDLYTEIPPISVGALAKYKPNPSLERRFVGESRFEDEYSLCYRSKEFLYLPRAVCPTPQDERDKRVRGFKCEMESRVVPRNDQQEQILEKSKRLLDKDESFIIQAGTGVGKTVMSMDLIAHVNRPTIVIVPSEYIYDQWIEAIKQFTNIPESRIGQVQGDVCDYKAKWITIAMLQSIAKEDRYPEVMYKQFGMVVFDECHRLGAEEFSKACTKFPALIRLGLSATPDRVDGKEALIKAHIGEVKVISKAAPLKFKVIRISSSWECPEVRTRNGWKQIEHNAGKCGHIINMVCDHDETNMKIAKLIEKSYNKNRTIIIYSDRIEHLKTLMSMTKVPAVDKGLFIGGLSKKQKEVVKGKRVLYSSSAMKEGVDIPWADTLIIASPVSNVKQLVGRIRREYDGKREPVVIDVLHDGSHVFRNYGRSRERWYKEEGATIVYRRF